MGYVVGSVAKTAKDFFATTILASLALLGSLRCGAGESPEFLRDVRPILKERCFACHGALQQQASLRVDSLASLQLGGDSGAAIDRQSPESSRILERISAEDLSLRMPPEGQPLTPQQQQTIRAWLVGGAMIEGEDSPEPSPQEHWAFQKPTRLPAPKVASDVDQPLDAWIADRAAREGVELSGPIAKEGWIRRVFIDLTGLPPSWEEVEAFVSDASPDASERLVDRLLASPAYGQRWGRHWMDIWRYSDWFGRRHVPDVWNSAPQIWRWRDWIVDSLNQDRGYDQMVQAMLAADELFPGDRKQAVATGYLIRNWYALNPNDWMRSNVEHASKAFLGLTVHCAHCHDHKYDPITQEDYFRMRAFFEPLGVRQDPVPGQDDPGPFQEYAYSELRKVQRLGSVQVFDKTPDAKTWFYLGGDERQRDEKRPPIEPGVPRFLGRIGTPAIGSLPLPLAARQPELHPDWVAFRDEQLLKQLSVAQMELAHAVLIAEDPAAVAAWKQAQIELESARKQTGTDPKWGPIEGAQSLLLDATKGRRTLQQSLSDAARLGEDGFLEFALRLYSPKHFNVQLARDRTQGATATFVGFEDGKILAYHPGGFAEHTVADFSFAPGTGFRVRIDFRPQMNQALLNVWSLEDGSAVVQGHPIAWNGFDPASHPNQGLFVDARPGARVTIDRWILDLGSSAKQSLSTKAPRRRWNIDFEVNEWKSGEDLVGREGWESTGFSQPNGVSRIVTEVEGEALLSLQERMEELKRRALLPRWQTEVLQAKVDAAGAQRESWGLIVKAERLMEDPKNAPADREDALQKAIQAWRSYERSAAASQLLSAQIDWAKAEALPADDANRAKGIEAASKRYQEAIAKQRLAEQIQTLPSWKRNYPATSSGRRRALALWITDRNHPLTARVAVNHQWLRHFGSPLVASVTDFGRQGKAPTHPQLLDGLAVDWMEAGWSMKQLHRWIVTSKSYLRSVQATSREALQRDPENRWLGRMNPVRMEAEVVRDGILALAGQLDETMGGQELENDQSLTTYRRSLYYSCHPETDGKSELGGLFDAPEAMECYRRTETVMPQQALALTNSDWVHRMSQQLARQIARQLPDEGRDDRMWVTAVFQQLLSRKPTEQELVRCEQFLRSETAGLETKATEPLMARASVVRAIWNHHHWITRP
jgi:hypothetical protein